MSWNTPDALAAARRRAELDALLVECVSSSLLHAVANYANIVVGRAGILELTRPNDPDVARTASEIRAQLDAISSLAERTREFVAGAPSAGETPSLSRELELACSELSALARARELELRLPAPGGELGLAVSSAALYAICRGLVGFALHVATPRSVVDVETERSDANLSLLVRVESTQALPQTRRELVAPWLVGEVEAREARLLLALALGTAQARGFRFETTSGEGRQTVVVHVPLSAGAR